MPSIFSRIVSGEIPAYKIAENDKCLAFLDVKPLAKGHTLVIPKTEVDYIFDMAPEEYKNLFAFAQQIAKGIHKAIPCTKVGIAVIGLEVPHAHIHLVPLNGIHDLNFNNPRLIIPDDEMKSIVEKIQNSL